MPDSTRWDSEDSEDSEDLPVPSQPTASENLEYIRLRMAGVPRAKARARAVQLVKQEQGSRASKRKAVDEGSSESRPASKKARNNARISTIDLTSTEDIESDQDGSDDNTIKPKSRSIVSIRKRSSSSSNPVNPFDICLKGDDDGSVPIYDSCDEIRRKIKRHLRSHGAPTKAAFLRDIAQAGYPDQGIKLQSKQLTDFLTKDGATSGSTSRIFYAAYVYFEKLRLATYASEQKRKGVKLEDVDFEKAPKNEHRKRMEAQWKRQGGFPREYHRYCRIRDDQVAYEDELGKLIITRRF